MKINITKKEYRLLIDIFSIADWVMNAYIAGDNPESEKHKKVEQRFFSYAKDFGFDNLIEYSADHECYFPTMEHDNMESDTKFIEEFEEDVFWDKLENSLAQRDLRVEKGVEKIKKMSPIEIFTQAEKFIENYKDEFAKNGIKNLKISK